MAKSNSAGKKPMGSGMQQTTLVARRSVVSPSNGSPKSDQLGLGGKKNGKKKKVGGRAKSSLYSRIHCIQPCIQPRLKYTYNTSDDTYSGNTYSPRVPAASVASAKLAASCPSFVAVPA